MKICGIVGSPNKNGNVDLFVSQVLKGASSQGAETHKIYLNDLNIKPCQSCGVDPYPRYCLFDDDMKVVYDALSSMLNHGFYIKRAILTAANFLTYFDVQDSRSLLINDLA